MIGIALFTLVQLGLPAEGDSLPRRMDGTLDWSKAVAVAAFEDLAQQPRARAVRYSDGYYRRLKVHRTLSYAMLPLFAGQFITGTKLINDPDTPPDDWRRKLHKPLAIGTGVVFTANTITGVWNLIESNKNPEGRTKRWVHGVMMLAADAGFAYTGMVLADKAKRDPTMRNDHRNLALASMTMAVSSWALMAILD